MRVLPLIVIAGILAGCGGLNEDEYLGRVTKAAGAVQRAMTSAGTDSRKLDASSKAIARVADDLDGAGPPGKDKHINAQIVGGFRKLAGSLHQAAQAGRNGDLKTRDDILDHLDKSPGMRQLEAAQAELEKLGV
jgi:hypothetical protein